jgi:hypothetical protein
MLCLKLNFEQKTPQKPVFFIFSNPDITGIFLFDTINYSVIIPEEGWIAQNQCFKLTFSK